MTIKEHIDVLKSLYYRGAPSDDRRFPDRFFSRILFSVRNRLIKDRIEKGGAVSEDVYTTVCIDLQNSPFHNCNCAEGACEFKRSVYKLPSILTTTKGKSLVVMNLNGEVIDTTVMDTNNYAKKYKLDNLSDNETAWLFQNRYIYILNNKFVKKLLVKALFTEDVSTMESCPGNGNICIQPSDNAFIPADMEPLLWEMSLKMINNGLIRDQDKLNDNQDGTEGSELGQQQKQR